MGKTDRTDEAVDEPVETTVETTDPELAEDEHSADATIPEIVETVSETPEIVEGIPGDIQVRDLAKREIDVRLLPWGTSINTLDGTEEFRRGAFDGTDPARVMFMGLEHEASIGIGQDGRPVLARHPVGRGLAYEDLDDGPHMTFRIAKTTRGDEVLALAEDRIVTGVSIEFVELPGGTITERRGGRRHRTHVRAGLAGASMTHRPAYGEQAAVLAVRSRQEGDAPMGTSTQEAAPVVATDPQPNVDERIAAVFEEFGDKIQSRAAAGQADVLEKMLGRLEALEERGRASFEIPSGNKQAPDDFHGGDWLSLVLRVMSGDKVRDQELQSRVAAELVTADNAGVIPDMLVGDVRETIDTSRPFLESTRQLNIPRAGMQLNVPVLETRPTVGVQAEEKDELTSTETSITQGNFNPTTIGGYGDISLQLLKRSDPSYLELYLDLLAEAYGGMSDDKAVDALLAASIANGGALDPENLSLGAAWKNGVAISRKLAPDRIWLSSDAVAAFIDAKAGDGTSPLYGNIAANFTAGGGVGGTVSGLRPVHVPALDDEAVDIIVGPSRGFGWAEDGTYTLQVDVPAKAGRDVGLVGLIWFAPLYPAAFTKYTLAS